ncbi:Nucleotidylyl transferase [Rhizoclosmatium globosum]|uniref:Nucleotidylyl transferase n=1 Tax=Rhizoclosmatium globosum TaxID=329046 RepID=A0A1Y2D3I6_9FUNG|nr:Nucleotidylyl transferase [Rhizoclosmatium globosum]|eukprot:ORY53853.1 Nucleotidylyl transferase [Rhizoclosmatium globosum]
MVSNETPIVKLVANFRRLYLSLSPQELESYQLLVLISTGTFAPVHLGHVAMMEQAKLHIESTNPNHLVLAGYLSPSHDHYTSYKLGRLNVSAPHRIKMCHLATETSTWMDVDPWESIQSRFKDYPQVVVRLSYYLNENTELQELLSHTSLHFPKIRVVYVCGRDHAMKCSLRILFGGVAVVERDQNSKSLEIELQERMLKMMGPRFSERCWIVPGNNDALTVSSTQVRTLLLEKESDITPLCGSAVAGYILENQLWT